MSATSLHRIIHGSSPVALATVIEPVELVVTSPPYPMITMWDEVFRAQSAAVDDALTAGDGAAAFEAMHRLLDSVWQRCAALLLPGGHLCINVGDATRRVGGSFRLFANHARIIQACAAIGLETLPGVIWRKTTNAPTKFMGSGMLPPSAYVTLEHEHILIFRKSGRETASSDRGRRRRSAYFWEERNRWFSDLWHVPGTRQRVAPGPVEDRERSDVAASRADGRGQTRDRSGAFPFEIAYRLVAMFSLEEDRVLDPFAGTGTTALAALRAARSSVSVEHDAERARGIPDRLQSDEEYERSVQRLSDHRAFLAGRAAAGRPSPRHHNAGHDVAVVTAQETDLRLPPPAREVTREETPDGWMVRARHEIEPEQQSLPFGGR